MSDTTPEEDEQPRPPPSALLRLSAIRATRINPSRSQGPGYIQSEASVSRIVSSLIRLSGHPSPNRPPPRLLDANLAPAEAEPVEPNPELVEIVDEEIKPTLVEKIARRLGVYRDQDR